MRLRLLSLPLLALFFAITTAEAELAGHGGAVRSVAVSPDGQRILTGGFDYSLMLWDLETQHEIARLHGHDAAVNAVAFLPDGRFAVSASDDGTVGLWDLEDRRLVGRLRGHAGKVASVAVSPDGRLAASAGWDHTVRIWDLRQRREIRVLRGHHSYVNAVDFSADGRRVISGGYEGTIRVWDAATGAPLTEMTANGFGINMLAALPRGGVASASIDESVRLWDLGSGRDLAELIGHEGPVLAVTVSPDGRLAASGGADGRLRLWMLAERRTVHSFEGHTGPVWDVAFSPDGKTLLSAGADGVVKLWDIAAEDEVGTGDAGQSAPAAASRGKGGMGASMFRKCSACHSVTADGENKAGPTLYGLFGRPAGSVPGYPYSKALRESDLVWTEETVAKLFDIGPDALTPGSKMPLQRIPDPHRRAALVRYLKSVTMPSTDECPAAADRSASRPADCNVLDGGNR